MKTTKTITKEFQYKGQQINYFNKIIKNDNITSAFGFFDAKKACYVIMYTYK